MQHIVLNDPIQPQARSPLTGVGIKRAVFSEHLLEVEAFYVIDNGNGGVTPDPASAPFTLQYDDAAGTWSPSEVETNQLSDDAGNTLDDLMSYVAQQLAVLLSQSATPGTVPEKVPVPPDPLKEG